MEALINAAKIRTLIDNIYPIIKQFDPHVVITSCISLAINTALYFYEDKSTEEINEMIYNLVKKSFDNVNSRKFGINTNSISKWKN